MAMSRSGLAKRASTWEACCVTGVRARRLSGRLERGSEEVGIDSGMGSDIFVRQQLLKVDVVVNMFLLRG